MYLIQEGIKKVLNDGRPTNFTNGVDVNKWLEHYQSSRLIEMIRFDQSFCVDLRLIHQLLKLI